MAGLLQQLAAAQAAQKTTPLSIDVMLSLAAAQAAQKAKSQ